MKATTGLHSTMCECGSHYFALPYHEELELWKKYRVSNIRSILERKGFWSPTPPTPLPHVLLVSPEDLPLLSLRRWRVVKSPARKKAKFEVRGRSRGKPLQRLMLPDAEVIQMRNNEGTDCRRENLKATTMKEVCRQREESKRLPAVGAIVETPDRTHHNNSKIPC